MSKTEADAIVAAIRSRGSDTDNVRDAAHEACHALDSKLRGRWERERIHTALSRVCGGDRGTMIYYEMRARAVESLIVERCDAVYEFDKWAHICWMETMKSMHINLPSAEWIIEQISKHRDRPRTTRMVDAIVTLKTLRKRARR